jgi:hypothetical protein
VATSSAFAATHASASAPPPGPCDTIVAGGDNEVSVTVDGVHNGWVARHGVTFDDCASNLVVAVDTQAK